MKTPYIIFFIVICFCLGCDSIKHFNGPQGNHNVFVPSLNRDFSLSPNLTYAAMMILNETSAHFLRVAHDLTLKPDVFESYQISEAGKVYEFELNPKYLSIKDEKITTADVIFTIKWYLQKNRSLAGVFADIEGAETCSKLACSGLKVLTPAPNKINIQLKSADKKFPEKIASPWIIVLKADRPEVESLGDCVIPYQTGRMKLTTCDKDKIELTFKEQKIAVSTNRRVLREPMAELLTSNPNRLVSPTLTSLGLFANPKSKLFQKDTRAKLLKTIRQYADEISKQLNLSSSAYLAPRWFGIKDEVYAVGGDKNSWNSSYCQTKGIRILSDTSIPGDRAALEALLARILSCPVKLQVTDAAHYFDEFNNADFGLCWFTPDFLALSNVYGEFQCVDNGPCYFDWKDDALQSLLKKLNRADAESHPAEEIALRVEKHLLNNGYVAPIAEMNWWISKQGKTVPIHPAGLFQVRLGDFL